MFAPWANLIQRQCLPLLKQTTGSTTVHKISRCENNNNINPNAKNTDNLLEHRTQDGTKGQKILANAKRRRERITNSDVWNFYDDRVSSN